MTHYLSIFTHSLLLTLLLEGLVFLAFGYARREHLTLLLLVNLLTNPAAVWLHAIAGIPQLPVELAVVTVEWLVYRSFRHSHHLSHPLALALAANSFSWLIGLLIQT